MSLYCDGDRCETKDMTVFYCEDCYIALKQKIEELEQEVSSLRDELKNIGMA